MKKNKTALYDAWINMRQRCRNHRRSDYSYYGARGISICQEWESFESFEDWAKNNGYDEGLTLDRINGNCGYSPGNCRWVDRHLQAINQKLRCTNTSGYRGVSFYKPTGRWKYEIRSKGKMLSSGYRSTARAAAEARDDFIIANKLPHKTNCLACALEKGWKE